MTRPSAATLAVFAFLFGSTAFADEFTSDLLRAATQAYPQTLLCNLEAGGESVAPDVPISEDVAHRWLRVRYGEFQPGGKKIAVVAYTRDATQSFERVFELTDGTWTPMAYEFTFSYDPVRSANPMLPPHHKDGVWRPIPSTSKQDLLVSSARGPAVDQDVVFSDLDKDGTKELILYLPGSPGRSKPFDCVLVLAYRQGKLTPIVPYGMGIMKCSNPKCGTPHCTNMAEPFLHDELMGSTDGVGFLDLDGDGCLELLLYGGNVQRFTWVDGERIAEWVPGRGTEVFKMVNGHYVFQYETAPGTAGTPPIGAAMKPASVPFEELLAIGSTQGGEKDEALTLYIGPPAGYAMDDVDWASILIGDLTLRPTNDKGDTPAPYPSGTPNGWVPWHESGWTMLLEDIPSSGHGQFQQKDADPCIYVSAKGRLHFSTPYRKLAFSKKAVFAWLLKQWQLAKLDLPLKNCVPEGNHLRCFSPIGLTIKVNLTEDRGFALGTATLWVETRENSNDA